MYTKLNFINDTLFLESFRNVELKKQADTTPPYVSSLISYVSDYVGKEFKGPDKTKAVVNLLAPGVAFTVLNAAGLTWIGLLVGLLMRIFKFDANNVLEKIRTSIMSKISSGSKFTSNEIKSIVDSAIPNTATEPKLESSSQELYILTKFAYGRDNSLKDLIDKAQKALQGSGYKTNILIKLFRAVLSWFVIVVLASAGFMVAGDAISGLINKSKEVLAPSNIPGLPGQSVPNPTQPKAKVPAQVAQSKFRINPKYTEENHSGKIWQINKPNTKVNIINTIFDFSEEVYPQLANKENEISNTPGFRAMLEHIEEYNDDIKGSNMFFMPPNYKSKKQIADLIVRDL